MTSERLWKQLCHLLHDERVAYGELGELLNEEWSLLRNLDYQSLLDVVRRKEDVLTQIKKLEQERVGCVKQLSQDGSQGASLDWVAKSTNPEAVPAQQALTQLIGVGQCVKQLGEKNSGLLSRGLHVVREAMNMVHEGLGLQPMYGQSGCLTFPSTSTSLNIEG